MRRPSGTRAIPARMISWVGRPWISWPSKTMRPPPAAASPVMARSVVVLPEPLAPSKVTIRPRGTLKLTPSTALMAP